MFPATYKQQLVNVLKVIMVPVVGGTLVGLLFTQIVELSNQARIGWSISLAKICVLFHLDLAIHKLFHLDLGIHKLFLFHLRKLCLSDFNCAKIT